MSKKSRVLGRILEKIADFSPETLGLICNLAEKLLSKNGAEWLDRFREFLYSGLIIADPTSEWYERDGVIYFDVTSDMTTGLQWIERLERKGCKISDKVRAILSSRVFKPTAGVKYRIAILKGMLWNDSDRIAKNIYAKAEKRKLVEISNVEVVCLIRERFSDKEIKSMGLWWIEVVFNPEYLTKDNGQLMFTIRKDGVLLADKLEVECMSLPDENRAGRFGGFAFIRSELSTSDPLLPEIQL